MELYEPLSYDDESTESIKGRSANSENSLLSKRRRLENPGKSVNHANVENLIIDDMDVLNDNNVVIDKNKEGYKDLKYVKFRRVLKYPPNDTSFMPITCNDGSRLYLRMKATKTDEEAATLQSGLHQKTLIYNWGQIKIEAEKIEKQSKYHAALVKTMSNEVTRETSQNKNDKLYSLWVEKYKPNRYIDLLSLEAVNKGLLHWLKLWDKSVFAVDYMAKVNKTRSKYAKLEAKENKRTSYLPSNENYDEKGRPIMKVALLAGDSGLGKTTLAHVIAKHAGYQIREINASDDRSIDIFRKVLDDTTESRAESYQNGLPNCLIIDEIDGAPIASVKVLVDYITGNAIGKGKGGKKKNKCLRRPVICICNDLYASCLKELRKLAFVVQFPQIPKLRLFDRLQEISSQEKLKIDSKTLLDLCERSDCDVRSCISTLQFLKQNPYSHWEASCLIDQLGTKDKSKGVYSIWTDLFTLPSQNKYQSGSDPSEMGCKNILRLVQNNGEYDKLFTGVFENYLRIKYKDSYLISITDGLEWASWFEIIKTYMERTQSYGLYGYLPMYFVRAHLFYARNDKFMFKTPNPQLSRAFETQTTAKSQIYEIKPSLSRFLDAYMIITEIYPALLNIIQPCTIRNIPSQFWTRVERDTVKRVVDLMLSYNLTYTQSMDPEKGAYSFVLNPNLEEVVRLKLENVGCTSEKKQFSYTMKQLVSKEIEMEKMRRNDSMSEVVDQSLDVADKTTVQRDFFGRPIRVVETTNIKKITNAVYFRYKEGHSNAVRRFVKMKDL